MKLLQLEGSVVPSRIVFGCADIGSAIPVDVSFAVMDRYVELGGNVFDTASLYARMYPGHEGTSEKTIGKWLGERKCRERMIIVTKGGHRNREPFSFGVCDRATLDAHITTSLTRMGIDYIDLYFLHHDEPTRPVADILDSLTYFRERGLIRRYGASNWQLSRLKEFQAHAASKGLPGFSATEFGYSLCHEHEDLAKKNEANRMVFMGDALWKWHRETQLPNLAYTSQARGYFGAENVEWAQAGFSGKAPKNPGFDCPENRKRLLKTIEIGKKMGVTANQVALAYLLNQPFAVYPIVATKNVDRLDEAMAAARIKLDDARLLSGEQNV